MSKMITIVVDEKSVPVEVQEQLVTEAQDMFNKMDADMDKGWQMGRFWVEKPTPFEKSQIVSNKILSAIESHNKPLLGLMVAYIANRFPKVVKIDIITSGELQEIELYED
jgi:hypothetical protein